MSERPRTANSAPQAASGITYVTLAVAFIAVVAVAWYFTAPAAMDDLGVPGEAPPAAADALIKQAREALQANDLEAANRLTQQLLTQDPNSPAVLLVAGELAFRQQSPNRALQLYARVPDKATPEGITALWAAGNVLLFMGHLREAEAEYRRVLVHDPRNPIANERLAFLLNVEGRRWEAIPFLRELVRRRAYSVEHLQLLANLDQTIYQQDFLDLVTKAVPDDPLPKLVLAQLAVANGRMEEAAGHLAPILKKYPDQLTAKVLNTFVIGERGTAEEFGRWNRGLPSEIEAYPDLWFARGNWCETHGDRKAATRCYWEAVKRFPGHIRANYRLGRLLVTLNERKLSEPFLTLATDLDELLQIMLPLNSPEPPLAGMVRAARLLDKLGRPWEAWAWYHTALTQHPEESSLRPELERLGELLDQGAPWFLDSGNPALRVDLSSYPLPAWDTYTAPLTAAPMGPAPMVVPHFENSAPAVGLTFQYQNGDDPQVPGMMIFQELCGGIAVLDFDQDGWPDIYLSQGCDWPPTAGQTEYTDRLFRNLGGDRFQDVTREAGLGDERFSQGVAAGDWNNDGFPDLYVGNLGVNRLYINNGDGTFTDVTSESGISGERWTTSVMLADLNGDRLPDIYDVTYLAGREPLTMVCQRDGQTRACAPIHFAAEQDRLYLNQGTGRFADITEQAGIAGTNGKGLGLMAADFDGSGRLSLFVANDTTPNFLYFNETPRPGEAPKFSERGLLMGLAYSRDGIAQASMGVALDDVENDGLLDMYVTNFFGEHNTLYKQLSADEFSDETQPAGIKEVTLPLLGFGTAFIDVELDGDPDLIVTNGHVDDFTYSGLPFRMPPQFFLNEGQGHFAELKGSTLGAYFDGQYLGRALARWDWNRDGRQDVVIMHVDEPLALLTNQTEGQAHFVAVHLRGTRTARDAIGAQVRVTAGGKTYVRQLTGGDGFHVSNQRTIHFGLGGAERVDRIAIQWPWGGSEQVLEDLAVDQEYIVVEDLSGTVALPRE